MNKQLVFISLIIFIMGLAVIYETNRSVERIKRNIQMMLPNK